MNKIYLVYSAHGEYDDYKETIEMAFTDINKAQDYIKELEDRENGYKCMADKCSKCSGHDNNCPFYVEPTYYDDRCENYNPHYDKVYYGLKEVELGD